MKNIKIIFINIIIVMVLSITACETDKEQEGALNYENTKKRTESENTTNNTLIGLKEENSNTEFDYKNIYIKKYEYPSEFYMGENLKKAIIQLALAVDDFEQSSVENEYWKDIFIAKFIQNSRFSFGYLNDIGNSKNGKVGVNELEYIHYSLTGVEMDFSSYKDRAINIYSNSSPLNYGSITNYDYEYTQKGVLVLANYEVGYDGRGWTQKYNIKVNLKRNPYSCFDGYSIVSIKSEEIKIDNGHTGDVYSFYGMDIGIEENGVFIFEVLDSNNDLRYSNFVYVDIKDQPKLIEYIRENSGKIFKIEFTLKENNIDVIKTIKPKEITLKE